MTDLEKLYLETKVEDGPIDVVIFDIGNVLVTYEERNFFKLRGFDDEMADKLAKATVRSEIWHEVDRSTYPFSYYINQMKENNPDIANQIEYALSDTSNICTPLEKTVDWIKRVKSMGKKAYYLSNYGKELFESSRKNLSCIDYLDGGIVSYEVDMIKPEKGIFEALFKKYNINPKRAVFIDDSIKNVIGASKCGLQTIHCKNQDQAIEDLEKLLLL